MLVRYQAGVLAAEDVGQGRLGRPAAVQADHAAAVGQEAVAASVRQLAVAVPAGDVVVVVVVPGEEGPAHGGHRVRHRVGRLLPHEAAKFLKE